MSRERPGRPRRGERRPKLTAPVLLSDRPGIDWRKLYRDQIENLQWPPAVTAAIPLAQLLALWGERDEPGRAGPPSRTQQLAMVNRLRAKKGLSPVEPVGWTPEPGIDWRADGVRAETEADDS